MGQVMESSGEIFVFVVIKLAILVTYLSSEPKDVFLLSFFSQFGRYSNLN